MPLQPCSSQRGSCLSGLDLLEAWNESPRRTQSLRSTGRSQGTSKGLQRAFSVFCMWKALYAVRV